MARTYPDTPAGRSRRIRDLNDADMACRGHRMRWRRWRKGPLRDDGNWTGAPGWEGNCTRCGDVVRTAALPGGGAISSFTRADGTQCRPRRCRKDRHS